MKVMKISKKHFIAITLLVVIFANNACNQKASDPKEAIAMLTSVPDWTIEEVTIDNAVTYKDGKIIKQFGGVDFERYMETVRFKTDGNIEGYYKGDTKPIVLKWKTGAKEIAVSAAGDSKGGAWTISPSDVTKESFVMKTESNAYDFPRVTKIELNFKKK